MSDGRHQSASSRARIPWPVWAVSGGIVVLLLSLANRYGFHRDELYFLAAGRRLDWGYVDQPPLTPLLARLGDLIPGEVTPFAIRILPALSAGLLVVMAAAATTRFGGSRRAVALSAVFAAGGGFYLAVGHLLSTTTFDVLIWAAICLVFIWIIDGADPRWWLGIGALLGVGMLNKHTVASLAVGLLVGMLLTPQRRMLRSPWPWIGAGIALAISVPNLVWQQANGWPQLEMAGALRAASDGPVDYLLLQLAILSVFLIIPAVAGWRWLFSDESGKKWRAIPLAFSLLFLVFIFTGGKGYYVAPLYVPLLAAGAMTVDAFRKGLRITTLSLIGIGITVGLFLGLPLVPPQAVNPFLEVNPELGETYGWNQLVDQVEAVYLSLDPDQQTSAVIFTANYGQAGAIEILGEDRLPQPISSHNNYWLWGPGDGEAPIIGVGYVGGVLEQLCPTLQQAGVIENEAGVNNDEAGAPLWLCHQPERSLSSVWNQLRHFN